MIQPDINEFQKQARRKNLIPVYEEFLADLETPVSAFLALDRGSYSFLLESVEGTANAGRYSFIGLEPQLVFQSRGKKITISKNGVVQELEGDPLEALQKLLADYSPLEEVGMPPFIGGAVGYLSYDMVRHLEKLPDANPDDLDLPDSCFIIPQVLVVFDRFRQTIRVICPAHVKGDPKQVYEAAARKVQQIVRILTTHMVKRPVEPFEPYDPAEIQSNFTQPEFERAVESCREYILAGDILQVVLSQRFSVPLKGEPFDLYRTLRTLNPSPYMFYLNMGGMQLVGSSPETMVRVMGQKAMVKPIAGTRKRGANAAEDRQLAAELLEDAKEGAEHVMLVDLGRNDLGRICRPGSVEVTEFRQVEHYSHVMHIVSSVEGILEEGQDAFSAIRATFPAGTVSGAPKIRAMEIIDELEPVRRGPYAGVVGYFSYNGNFDSCITIRTAVVKGNRVFVQAGAGIVADSQPEAEYRETQSKARALLVALGMKE